ncbi:MAG: hypothetical protein M3352_00850 [Bacteroidota bacterium]|nr:hypothetical protein [Bacteroidota bacterium]
MINNISWQGYWISIALLTASYYLVLFLLYYRNEFKHLFSARQVERVPSAVPFETNEKVVHQPQLFSGEFSQASVNQEKPEVIAIEQALKDEVQAFFDEAQKSITKKDLLVSLQGICNKYPTVFESPYQQSVNQFIIFLAEQNCSVHLSAEEVSGVWLK